MAPEWGRPGTLEWVGQETGHFILAFPRPETTAVQGPVTVPWGGGGVGGLGLVRTDLLSPLLRGNRKLSLCKQFPYF